MALLYMYSHAHAMTYRMNKIKRGSLILWGNNRVVTRSRRWWVRGRLKCALFIFAVPRPDEFPKLFEVSLNRGDTVKVENTGHTGLTSGTQAPRMHG